MEEALFNKITKHLLEDDQPSIYLNQLRENDTCPEELFLSNVLKLDLIPQNKKYHPEGHVWNHVMMVVDQAAQIKNASSNPKAFMWGAFLHDIGKLTTTKVRKGRITSYDHDKEGRHLAEKVLHQLTDDSEFIDQVLPLVRWHMQPLFVSKNLPFKDLRSMVKDIIPTEIALLSICDRLGRGEMNEEDKKRELVGVIDFLKACIPYASNEKALLLVINELEKEMD